MFDLMFSSVRNLPLWIEWKIFRLSCHRPRHGAPTRETVTLADAERMTQEDTIKKIVSETETRTVLEIGIGAGPHIDRLSFMLKNGVHYTGCDFTVVCEHHRKQIERARLDSDRIRLLGNSVGSYSWTLFELLNNGEQFDAIYLDGHHTFYVDLPALTLAHYLLKPGGYFLADDIQWTLSGLRNNLMNSFDEWRFYRNVYHFADYSEDQQELPHIGLMVERILMKQLGYQKIEAYSTPYWWTLRKPRAPMSNDEALMTNP